MEANRDAGRLLPALDTISSVHVESAEEFLSNPEILLKILDNIQEGIYLIRPDLELVYMNRAMKQWFDVDKLVPGSKCHEIFHGRPTPCEDCPALRSLRSGAPHSDMSRYERNGVDIGVLRIFKAAITNAAGEVILIFCYTQNITTMVSEVIDEVVYPRGAKLVSRMETASLSPREIEVARFIREGYTSQQIADALVISKKAVDFHRGNIRNKLGLKPGENLRAYLEAAF